MVIVKMGYQNFCRCVKFYLGARVARFRGGRGGAPRHGRGSQCLAAQRKTFLSPVPPKCKDNKKNTFTRIKVGR